LRTWTKRRKELIKFPESKLKEKKRIILEDTEGRQQKPLLIS